MLSSYLRHTYTHVFRDLNLINTFYRESTIDLFHGEMNSDHQFMAKNTFPFLIFNHMLPICI